MNIKDIELKLNFDKMLAGLFFKEELVKTFDLNKKTPGTLIDFFYWEYELEDNSKEKVRHEIIIEIGKTSRGVPIDPIFQIYPIAGDHVIHKVPKKCDVRKGTIEDYFNNHKFYKED